jgi:hypothetical protein
MYISPTSMLASIAEREVNLALVTNEYDGLMATAAAHCAHKDAIRAVLRPTKGVRLPTATLDGVTVSEADVDSARALQTLASRKAAKKYDDMYQIFASIQAGLGWHVSVAEAAQSVRWSAGRDVSAFAEAMSDHTVTLWLWPSEITDADEQAAVAVGLVYGRTGITLVNADRVTSAAEESVDGALRVIGQRLAVAVTDDDMDGCGDMPCAYGPEHGGAIVPEVAEAVAPAAPKAKRARKAKAPDAAPVIDTDKLRVEFVEDAAAFLALTREVAAIAAIATSDELDAYARRIDTLQTSLGGIYVGRLPMLAGVDLPLSVEADILAAQPYLAAVRDTLVQRTGGNSIYTYSHCDLYAGRLMRSLEIWRETVPGAATR